MITADRPFRLMTDKQCLLAIHSGRITRVKPDPLLKQTYRSILWGEDVVYFKTLAANQPSLQDNFALSLFESALKRFECAEVEAMKERECRIPVEYLFLLLGRDDILNGEVPIEGEALYVSGKNLVNILIAAGYDRPELTYEFTVEPDRLYHIPPIYLELEDGDWIADLIPDNVCDIVNNTNPHNTLEELFRK